MVAALTEEGSYSVFELLGSDSVEVRDQVSWNGCVIHAMPGRLFA
jgi:hypothetical protein